MNENKDYLKVAEKCGSCIKIHTKNCEYKGTQESHLRCESQRSR